MTRQDRTTQYLGTSEIARLGGITEDHVKKVIRECRAEDTPEQRKAGWHGMWPVIRETEAGFEVALPSLPTHIREAFVMRDQPELPPPPRNKKNENNTQAHVALT